MCSFIYKDINKSQNGSYNMMIFLGTGQVGFVPGKKHNIKTDPPDFPEALKAHSMVNGSALHIVLKLTQAHSEPWTSIPLIAILFHTSISMITAEGPQDVVLEVITLQ